MAAGLGGVLADTLKSSPVAFIGMLSFGASALLFMVAEELLLDAHEGGEHVWWVDLQLCTGFFASLMAGKFVRWNRKNLSAKAFPGMHTLPMLNFCYDYWVLAWKAQPFTEVFHSVAAENIILWHTIQSSRLLLSQGRHTRHVSNCESVLL